MKILFQGDSITDCGRNRADIHSLGNGYPYYSAELISAKYPDISFEFINQGIGGDRAESLLARWENEAIAHDPDIISILIGVNDTWHHASPNDNWMKHSYFEHCYRSILTALAISGALAGLGGSLQLMGMGSRISVFSSQEGFGFAGIVVALIGCSNPFGVLIAGIFYGALTFGGSKLNLVGAPTQLINVIVGTVVFFIAISIIFTRLKYLKRKPEKPKPTEPDKKAEGKEAAEK